MSYISAQAFRAEVYFRNITNTS
nr:hypothetical protein SHINE37_100282 [Rhizobiaceae bacterium]